MPVKGAPDEGAMFNWVQKHKESDRQEYQERGNARQKQTVAHMKAINTVTITSVVSVLSLRRG